MRLHQNSVMPERTSLKRILELLFAFILVASIVQGSVPTQTHNVSQGQKLILNVYLDKTGKALVTGYVQNVDDLPFLNASQYRYENDTLQLYALTDALTQKNGDLWNLKFASMGYYDDYHVAFYLPSDLMLKRINVTQGIEYLLSASNQSLVADIQGYEVQDPSVILEYQQPLAVAETQGHGSYLAQGLAALLLGLVVIWFARRRRSSMPTHPDQATNFPEAGSKSAGETSQGKLMLDEEIQKSSPESTGDEGEFIDIAEIESAGGTESAEGIKSTNEIMQAEAIKSYEAMETSDEAELAKETTPTEVTESSDVIEPDKEVKSAELTDASEGTGPAGGTEPVGIDSAHSSREETKTKKEVEVSSEMAAVMETLTARERAIIQALIEAGGRMTQADLRYETGTPKSSLSGILLSLERRKIIIKKEWGRTNVIELSEWFITKKERF